MSLQSALRLLRGARATQTPRDEATPDTAVRSGPPGDVDIGAAVAGRSAPPRAPAQKPASPDPLPQSEDDEATRWAKLRAMRLGSGMSAVIIDATRPRSRLDHGATGALVRDSFSPWHR